MKADPLFRNVMAAEFCNQGRYGEMEALGLETRRSRYGFKDIDEFRETVRYLIKYHLQVVAGKFVPRQIDFKKEETADTSLENCDYSFFNRDLELSARVQDIVTGDVSDFEMDQVEAVIDGIYREFGANDLVNVRGWRDVKIPVGESNRRRIGYLLYCQE
jgi:hypothetical protein